MESFQYDAHPASAQFAGIHQLIKRIFDIQLKSHVVRARAFVYVSAYVDDTQAEPHEVCLTYMSESSGMARTVLFHVKGLK